MLHALCKGLLAKQGAAFDLLCSLPPLPLCGVVSFPLPRLSTGRSVVSDKTHVSFRTKCIPAAKGVAEGNITVQREWQRKEK